MKTRGVGATRQRALSSRLLDASAIVFTVLLRWWITRDRVMYSGLTDEGGELAIARSVFSTPFRVVTNAVDPLFGILVAPIHVVVDDPEVAFRLVLLTNVAMAGVSVLVLRAVLVRVIDIRGPAATWSAAVALALPGAAMQTPYAGSEVLVVLVVALALLFALSLGRGAAGTRAALGLAVVGASSVVLHSRLVAMILAVLVILAVSAWAGELSRRVAAVASVLLLVLSWMGTKVNEWVFELVWLPQAPEPSQLPDLLERLGQPVAIIASGVGMAWHQMVTTFGLVVVGVGYLVVTSVRRAEQPRIGASERQRWKVLLLVGAAAAPAVVFMADRPLAGHMVYGRYWDAIAVPVVTIALGYLWRTGRRDGVRAVAGGILATGVTGVLLHLGRQGAIDASLDQFGFDNPRRIAGLLAYVVVDGRIDISLITMAALAAMAGALAVLVLAGRRYRLLLLVTFAVLATAATGRASVHLNQVPTTEQRWRPAIALVEDGVLPDGATVAFQLDDEAYDGVRPQFPFAGYQFYQPHVEFVGLEGDEVLDFDWVVSGATDPRMVAGDWEVVFEHPSPDVVVWGRS